MPSPTQRSISRGFAPSRPGTNATGLSLVELLVGIAIGLLIVAAAVVILSGHLRDTRSLLIEGRLLQDLRSAADVVSRDLRRAGYWGAAEQAVPVDSTTPTAANPYTALTPGSTTAAAASFSYSRDATENGVVDANEQLGFRLQGGALEMQLGAGNWQTLTDAGTMVVTAFSVTPTTEDIVLPDLCASPCPVGSTTCPPRLAVRTLAVRITGRATADAAVVRTVRSQVRLRNDRLSGACA